MLLPTAPSGGGSNAEDRFHILRDATITGTLNLISLDKKGLCSATSDLCVGTLGDLAEVILSPGGDASEEDLLGDASSQSHTHAVQKLLLGVQVLFPGEVLGITQALPSWDDGHLHK